MVRSEHIIHISYNTTPLKHMRNWNIVIIPKLHIFKLNDDITLDWWVDKSTKPDLCPAGGVVWFEKQKELDMLIIHAKLN